MKKSSQQAMFDMALARAAHDMRNPLQVISGTAELLLLQAKDSAQQGALERIVQQAEFMTLIMDDLIDFARPTEASFDEISLLEMQSRLEVQVADFAESESVKVRFSEPPSLSLPVVTIHRVSRILLNLINNAIAQSYGGTVAVHTSRIEGQIVFCIEDSGAGIEYNPNIANQASIFAEKGLGIGIVCSLTARLDGRVVWEKSPSSRVTVEIPL